MANGFARRRAQDDAVGPVEIFDRAAVGEEHRLANQQAAAVRSAFSALLKLRRRTHPHRRHDGQHLEAARPRAPGGRHQFFQSLGRIFGEKNHLRLARQIFRIGRIHQASRAHIAPDHFLQIFFVERDVALGNFHDARAVGVAAADRRAEIGETGRNDGCEIAGSINPDLHMHSLPIQPAAWDPALISAR